MEYREEAMDPKRFKNFIISSLQDFTTKIESKKDYEVSVQNPQD